MWFKQIQLFQLTTVDSFENLINKLEVLRFTPCLPSMPDTFGWIDPIEEDNDELAVMLNGYVMMCMQVEEKILPAIVIRQELMKKIKKIEAAEARKMRQKEKLALKDEIIHTLMPRAFTKLSKIYAYIDIKNRLLVLGTNNTKMTERFLGLFKKSVSDDVQPIQIKKLAPIITHWIKNHDYPSVFAIEKTCMLQDPSAKDRIIRCQQQDLFSNSIQSLINDGCEVKQLGLSWQDQINFVLTENFSLSGIKFQDSITTQAEDMEAETKVQQFNTDFLIMSATLANLFKDLLSLFVKTSNDEKTQDAQLAVT